MGMFVRYTEKARTTIINAKHEADGFGSQEISPEHILLALLRDTDLTTNCMKGVSVKEIHEAISAHLPRRERNPLPHDLPLSTTAREALVVAEQEANRLGHQHIRNDHLLLGLVHSKASYLAELLTKGGFSADKLRRHTESLPS
jgi:ATP-dependent Clp protease ATP-binding subunit ClpA